MKPKKAKFTFVKRDRNLENAYTMGKAARENGKPCTACPNLLSVFGEEYGTQLCDRWMQGWFAADQQMEQGRLEMKGAD